MSYYFYFYDDGMLWQAKRFSYPTINFEVANGIARS